MISRIAGSARAVFTSRSPWQDDPMKDHPETDVRVAYRRPLWIGTAAVVAGVILGVGILVGLGNATFGFDAAWQDLLSASRGPAMLAFSYALDWIGGGWFGVFAVPIGVAIILLIMRRPWGAGFFLAAEIVSVLAVQLLKQTIGRARPEDILVHADVGSFPSGHVANAATIAVALFVLFPKVWVAVGGAVWTLAMAFSRTYLGAHWISDTIGGALVGAGAALLVAAAFAKPLAREEVRHGAKRAPEAAPGKDPGPS
jgi:membrane-associated phospholipid phosphatase